MFSTECFSWVQNGPVCEQWSWFVTPLINGNSKRKLGDRLTFEEASGGPGALCLWRPLNQPQDVSAFYACGDQPEAILVLSPLQEGS